MEKVKEIVDFIIENPTVSAAILTTALTSAVGVVSIIVKLTPTLADDNALLPIIKWLSKFVALNDDRDHKSVRKENI